jgi:predicted DNA-binding transcriptional regulator AlpA
MSIQQHTPAKRSFTIIEWCAMRGYSRGFFYRLRERGDAPETIGVGKAQRVSDEADARWLKRQEAKARRRAS